MTSSISWALISFKIFALKYLSLWNTIFLGGVGWAELKLKNQLSSVSTAPSAPSRGPLCFFLTPNGALKGLFVVFGIFCKPQLILSLTHQKSFLSVFTIHHYLSSAPSHLVHVLLQHEIIRYLLGSRIVPWSCGPFPFISGSFAIAV